MVHCTWPTQFEPQQLLPENHQGKSPRLLSTDGWHRSIWAPAFNIRPNWRKITERNPGPLSNTWESPTPHFKKYPDIFKNVYQLCQLIYKRILSPTEKFSYSISHQKFNYTCRKAEWWKLREWTQALLHKWYVIMVSALFGNCPQGQNKVVSSLVRL